MAVIDLNEKITIDNKSTVILPMIDKKFEVVYNDSFTLALNKGLAKIEKIREKYDKTFDDPEVEKMSDKELQDNVVKAFNLVKKTTLDLADEVLGKGAGKLMYDTYNHDTTAVSAVLGAINEEAEKAVSEKKLSRKQKRMAKYKKK